MDNQTVSLSDVERNKELFEYEMTEVLRQLKGAFANDRIAVPGLEDLSVPEVRMQAEIPAVNVQPVTLPAENTAVPKITAAAPLPEIKAAAVSCSCPEIPAVKPAEMKPLQMAQTAVSVPEIPTVKPAEMKPLQMTRTAVSVPEIPAFKAAEMKPVQTVQKAVSVPEIPVVKPVRMPETPAPSVDIGELPAPVSIPAFTPAEAAPVAVPAVQAPDAVRADFRADQLRVTGKVSVGEIPIPAMKPFVPHAVSFTAQNPVQTEIPQIRRIEPVPVKAVSRPEIRIPDMTASAVPDFAPAQISVTPFRMAAELASLPKVPENIPQADFTQMQIRVPEDFPDPVLPDFSAEIRGILEAAANEA